MRKSIYIELAILLGAFFILWFALLISNIFPDEVEINLISVEQEEELGELFFDAFFDESDIISEPSLDSAIVIIRNRLLEQVGATDYEYKIMIVKDEEVNAFALPGGTIVIFSGLIKFTKTPEELASIVAHEIGHIELRHVHDRLIKQIGLSTLLLILTNDSNIITEVAFMLISTAFDRSQEDEADDYSLELMLKCNLDPRSIGYCFKRLIEEKKNYDFLPVFLSTHPSTEKRIQKALNYKMPKDFVPDSLGIDWDRVKNIL